MCLTLNVLCDVLRNVSQPYVYRRKVSYLPYLHNTLTVASSKSISYAPEAEIWFHKDTFTMIPLIIYMSSLRNIQICLRSLFLGIICPTSKEGTNKQLPCLVNKIRHIG